MDIIKLYLKISNEELGVIAVGMIVREPDSLTKTRSDFKSGVKCRAY